MMIDKTKSILCVHKSYELYGSDRSFVLSLKALLQAFPDSTIDLVLAQGAENGLIQTILPGITGQIEYRNSGVICRADIQRFNFRRLIRAFTNLPSVIRKCNQYSLVYINTMMVLDFMLASRFSKTKTIIHVREIPNGLPKLLFSLILRFSKADLLFNSEATFRSFYFIRNKKHTVIHNGSVGYTEIEPISEIKGKINFLLIGRFNRFKGQDFFIKALSKLDKTILDKINVRLVGSVFKDQHFYKNRVIDLINTYNLHNIVNIEPFTSDPSAHYRWAHIVVMPSVKPEPFGLVAIESMSAGRIVIAAKHGGLPEILQHEETGYLFEPNNPESLANTITMLVNNTDKVVQLGAYAKTQFRDKFTDEHYAEKLTHAVKTAVIQ